MGISLGLGYLFLLLVLVLYAMVSKYRETLLLWIYARIYLPLSGISWGIGDFYYINLKDFVFPVLSAHPVFLMLEQ